MTPVICYLCWGGIDPCPESENVQKRTSKKGRFGRQFCAIAPGLELNLVPLQT